MEAETLGNIAGISACVLVIAMLIQIHFSLVKVYNPEKNKDDYMLQFFLWTVRGGLTVMFVMLLIVIGSIYLKIHPHGLDFLVDFLTLKK